MVFEHVDSSRDGPSLLDSCKKSVWLLGHHPITVTWYGYVPPGALPLPSSSDLGGLSIEEDNVSLAPHYIISGNGAKC